MSGKHVGVEAQLIIEVGGNGERIRQKNDRKQETKEWEM